MYFVEKKEILRKTKKNPQNGLMYKSFCMYVYNNTTKTFVEKPQNNLS